MSETMSTPTDWAKFYQQNLPGDASSSSSFSASVSSSAVLIKDSPISPLGSPLSASAPISSSSTLSPEGRVSKPARRRSRASRRTPTTLLNTDTTNFRAMVQQFTGGPNAPFASAAPPHGPGATAFSFSLGTAAGSSPQAHPHIHNPNPSSVMASPGYRLQYQQLPQYTNQNQGYMISLSNVNNPGAGDHGFFQRIGVGVGGGNLRPPSAEVSDGFLMDSSSSQNVLAPRLPSNSSENRRNGFMF